MLCIFSGIVIGNAGMLHSSGVGSYWQFCEISLVVSKSKHFILLSSLILIIDSCGSGFWHYSFPSKFTVGYVVLAILEGNN